MLFQSLHRDQFNHSAHAGCLAPLFNTLVFMVSDILANSRNYSIALPIDGGAIIINTPWPTGLYLWRAFLGRTSQCRRSRDQGYRGSLSKRLTHVVIGVSDHLALNRTKPMAESDITSRTGPLSSIQAFSDVRGLIRVYTMVAPLQQEIVANNLNDKKMVMHPNGFRMCGRNSQGSAVYSRASSAVA